MEEVQESSCIKISFQEEKPEKPVEITEENKYKSIKDDIWKKLNKYPRKRWKVRYSEFLYKYVKRFTTKYPNLKCQHCNKVFKSKYSLHSHLLNLHDINAHQCTICKSSFSHSHQLKDHIKKDHLEIDEEYEKKILGENYNKNSKNQNNNDDILEEENLNDNLIQNDDNIKITTICDDIQENSTLNQKRRAKALNNNNMEGVENAELGLSENGDEKLNIVGEVHSDSDYIPDCSRYLKKKLKLNDKDQAQLGQEEQGEQNQQLQIELKNYIEIEQKIEEQEQYQNNYVKEEIKQIENSPQIKLENNISFSFNNNNQNEEKMGYHGSFESFNNYNMNLGGNYQCGINLYDSCSVKGKNDIENQKYINFENLEKADEYKNSMQFFIDQVFM